MTAAPDPAPPASQSAWAPLRQPLFRTLALAALVSNIGLWLQNVGAAWLMTSLTSSAAMVAFVQAATTLPMVLLALLAGALADVVDVRKLLVATQAWMLATVAALGVLTLLGLASPWVVLGLTFLFGIGLAISTPAWQGAMLPLVSREEIPAAIGIFAVSINLARAIGPTVGGISVAVVGAEVTFLLNAALFLLVIVPLYRWRRSPARSALPPEHLIDAMQSGARYVRYSPELRAVLLRTGVFILGGSALWALLPVVARRELGLGALGYGGLLGGLGVGAVAGAALLPRARRRVPVEVPVAAATVLFALVAFALAYVRNVPALGGVLVLGGVAWLALLTLFIGSGQAVVPAWVRARAMAVQLLVFFAGMGLGGILWGAVAELAGTPIALTVAAAVMVLGLATARTHPLPTGERLDLTPDRHWAEPILVTEPSPDRGPVAVTVEYRIDPARRRDFARAMKDVRLERLRDGAMGWTLYSDPTDPGRYVESIVTKSWTEHERAHERVTVADRAIESCARTFHIGKEPPAVTHLVAEPVPPVPDSSHPS